MAKRMSPAALVALKDALYAIYWYKGDLRSFLQHCLSDPLILSRLDWSKYKRQIVSDLVDFLTANQHDYLGDLTRLCYAVCEITSFHHLEQLDGGAEKAERARGAIEQLKRLLKTHEQAEKEQQDRVARHRRQALKLKANAAVREKLEDIRDRYAFLVMSENAQDRGFKLEKVMHDLFELFDLDPRASFRNDGEQIDGAFSLEGTDYLFEAKWQKELVGVSALDAFAAKVKRKLDNTLGVFLSISGFTPKGVAAHSSSRAMIILMDGADLMAVLEERIDFASLLLRKKRHAAQTGEIYLSFREISGAG